jgi:hypothetical protein
MSVLSIEIFNFVSAGFSAGSPAGVWQGSIGEGCFPTLDIEL